jgi:hypothetical protein
MAKPEINIFDQGKDIHLKVKDREGGWSEVIMDADTAEDLAAGLKTVARVVRRN